MLKQYIVLFDAFACSIELLCKVYSFMLQTMLLPPVINSCVRSAVGGVSVTIRELIHKCSVVYPGLLSYSYQE